MRWGMSVHSIISAMKGFAGFAFLLCMLVLCAEAEAAYKNHRDGAGYASSGYGGGGNSEYGYNEDNGYSPDKSKVAAILPILALSPFVIFALSSFATNAAVVSSSGAGGNGTSANVVVQRGRKKRSESTDFFLDILAQHVDHEELHSKLVAAYLSCSADTQMTLQPCLLQLACKLETENAMEPMEMEVAELTIASVLNNTHVAPEFRKSIRKALLVGKKSGDPGSCDSAFKCTAKKS